MRVGRSAFTLLELLVVMSIMGIMATVSVNSYQSMKRGLADGAVVRNASQFVRLAYQRSLIDRVPVNIYFWNETRHQETDYSAISVVGRAVAVRRQGRVSAKDGKYLMDEFGDLEVFAFRDEEGKIDNNDESYTNDGGMYLYKANGDEKDFSARTRVGRTCPVRRVSDVKLISYPDDGTATEGENNAVRELDIYSFYVSDGKEGLWQKGDAYGLEFADFETPVRYIFGRKFSLSEENPIQEIQVMNFNPLGGTTGSADTIEICAIRPGPGGQLAPNGVGATVAPGNAQQEQNE